MTPAGIRPVRLASIEGRLAEEESRRRAIVDAAAKVLVLRGYGPHARARVVNGLLPRGLRVHSDNALRVATGGWRRLAGRLGEGGLFAPGELGQWGEGLMVGLRLSGALRQLRVGERARLGTWSIGPLGLRPGLELAMMGGFPFSGEAKVAGQELMVYRFWAGNLGAADPGGEAVVAGLLMGAIPVGHVRRSWLGVPSSPACRGLLDSWGIPRAFVGHQLAKRRVVDLVSPFWGALLAHLMPGDMAGWFSEFKSPGQCPLLPWAFLRMAGGRVSDEFPKGGLPYLVTRDVLYDAGVRLGEVHERAVRELGLARVDPRLRKAWVGHMASRGMAFPFPP